MTTQTYIGAYSGQQIDGALGKVLDGALLEKKTYDPHGKSRDVFAYADMAAAEAKEGSIAHMQPVVTEVTMLADGWSGNVYSFEADYPAAAWNLSIEVSPTATAEQFTAFGEAMICGSAAGNTATALGTAPAVDIPIIIKAVAK